jgi:hypothetical protein
MKIEMKDEVSAGVIYNLKLRDASKDEQQRLNECFEFYQNSIRNVEKTKNILLTSIIFMVIIGLVAAALQNNLLSGILLVLLIAMNFMTFQYCRYCFLSDVHTLVLRDCIADWEKEGKPQHTR